MEVPLLEAHNGNIFVKKNHLDHLKWVSDCQSSKKLGKEDEKGKSQVYDVSDTGVVFRVCVSNITQVIAAFHGFAMFLMSFMLFSMFLKLRP